MNNILIEGDSTLNELISNNYTIKGKVIINLDKFKYNKIIFNLEDNAHVIINKKYNEKEIDEEITINLNGINSKVDFYFSTKVYNDQKYILNVNHLNKYTTSNIINHGVVMNDSKLYFEVNSSVKKGNIKSKLNQENKIIVMSKNNSTIKPNLFIDEFDVDAIHAATIGKFNKEDIFYLMTKGISEENANLLLIDGFLEGIFRR